MNNWVKLALSLGVAFQLGACATSTHLPQIDPSLAADEAKIQYEEAWTVQRDRFVRGWRIYSDVGINNVEACGDKVIRFGGYYLSDGNHQGDEISKEAHKTVFGEKGTVLGSFKGHAFDRADIRVGDVVTHVDGRVIRFPWALKYMIENEKYEVTIKRGDETHYKLIEPDKMCNYPLAILPAPEINAFADGKQVYLTNGMMRFANDDELALVLGHELAHNTMAHSDKKLGQYLLGAILGAAVEVATGLPTTQIAADAAASAGNQDKEAEADYVGLYYAANAGYDISNAPEFWRKMANESPQSIHLAGGSHPSTAKRFVLLKKTIEEIEIKRIAGDKIEPNFKKKDEVAKAPALK